MTAKKIADINLFKEKTMPDSIEAINGYIDKNSTVNPDGSLRVKGFNELNKELNKGKPFIGDILEFALTHDRLPTDAEIAEMPKQGEGSLSEIQANWNRDNPNSPMQFEGLPYEIGSPEHRKAQLEFLEKESLRSSIKQGALRDTEPNRLAAGMPAKESLMPPLEGGTIIARRNLCQI